MFTPPPSPLPSIVVTDENENEMDPFEESFGKASESKEGDVWSALDSYRRKRRDTRRLRWSILLVPVVLILVGLSSHRICGFNLDWDLSPDDPEPSLGNASVVDHFVTPPKRDLLDHHYRRQASTISSSIVSASSIDASTVSASATASSASLIASSTTTIPQTSQTVPTVPDTASPPTLPTPFPQPFDTTGSASNVTTQSCEVFFNNMTNADSFRQCRAFSLLSQFSEAFIEAQTNLTALNALIWGTCNTTPSFDTCVSNTAWFATNIKTACKSELDDDNEMVTQTLLGLESYSLMRDAACTINQQGNTYCYTFAAHESSPYDLYLYSLPMGIGMPSNAKPSCSTCAGSLLGLYADAIQNGNSSADGLKNTYENAADSATESCGSGFAAIGLEKGSAAVKGVPLMYRWWTVALALAFAFLFARL